MTDPSTATITVGGLLAAITIAGAVFRMVGWIRGIVENSAAAQRADLKESEKIIHRRIDRANAEAKEIREDYVRRADLDRHFKSFDEKLDGLGVRIEDLSRYMQGRRPDGG